MACALTVWAYLGCAAAVKAARVPPARAICAARAALAAGNAHFAAPGLGAAARAALPAPAAEPAAQCALKPYLIEPVLKAACLHERKVVLFRSKVVHTNKRNCYLQDYQQPYQQQQGAAQHQQWQQPVSAVSVVELRCSCVNIIKALC